MENPAKKSHKLQTYKRERKKPVTNISNSKLTIFLSYVMSECLYCCHHKFIKKQIYMKNLSQATVGLGWMHGCWFTLK